MSVDQIRDKVTPLDLEEAAREAEALREALRLALPILEYAAQEDASYGYFFVGDPRLFSPDPEASTPGERAAHAADCATWDRGERTPVAPVHAPIDMERSVAGQIKGAHSAVLLRDDDGVVVGGHVTKSSYGMGTNTVIDDEAVAALEACRKALRL